ncbi:conserved hypothetical protein [Chloroherpeton thalassium ATCC 35110]|uniref:Regulator of microtubule dynamics protein 1 n=1 Tax=Chloroherpeton thalassium (strain ATCC 35110 / GB-78) TaxID=517418 RepID=B3QUZ0_CHLT3|nr:hypothetical protein [Chloroherpeton thalassium]ACF14491.1 conserved hypothetical protein [Chloroherpeton thalassium ATCC 35110]
MNILLALFLMIADTLTVSDSTLSMRRDSLITEDNTQAKHAFAKKDTMMIAFAEAKEKHPEADTLGVISIQHGDEAFQKIDYDRAQAIFEKLYQRDSTSAALLWRMARLNVCMGDAISYEKREEREVYYSKAVQYGQKAIECDDKNSQAHAWLAAAYGVRAENSDSKERIRLATQVKLESEKAIKLDSTNGIAYSILGSYYRAIANIGWFERMIANTFLGSVPDGTYEEAEAAFKKAIALQPNVLRHYHEFALLYLDMGKEKEAIQLLKTALTKPILMKNDKKRKREIKELLKEYDAE